MCCCLHWLPGVLAVPFGFRLFVLIGVVDLLFCFAVVDCVVVVFVSITFLFFCLMVVLG